MKERHCSEQKTECDFGRDGSAKALRFKNAKGKLSLNLKHLWGMFAALYLTVAFAGGAVGVQNISSSISADAYSSTYAADWTSSKDLLKTAASDGQAATFNIDVLDLVAKSGGYSSVLDMMGKVLTSGENLKASKFLTNPDTGAAISNGIQILFGGLYWTPVYVTLDNSNNVVLDLMLSSSTTTLSDGTTSNEKAVWCSWTGFSSDDYKSDVYEVKYQDCLSYSTPSNMYSTSYIRSVLVGTGYSLNTNGGYKANSNSDICLTTGTQSSKWTTFLTSLGWDPDSTHNYCPVLDSPSEVGYQKTETLSSNIVLRRLSSSDCPNDAYGELPAEYFMGNYINYLSSSNYKYGYTDWQYDYLWLPSLTEAGVKNRAGLWGLTDAQLANEGGTWYRSGGVTNSSYAYCTNADGSYTATNAADCSYGVRPAIHLNLNKVTGYEFSSDPTEESATYTGNQMDVASITSELKWYKPSLMTITFPENCKNAGEYECTVKFADDSSYYFYNGTKTATFTLTVNAAPLTATITVDDDGNKTTTFVGLKGNDATPPYNYIYYDTVNNILLSDINSASPGEYYVGVQLQNENGNYYIENINPGTYKIPEETIDGKEVLAKPELKQNSFVYSGTSVDIQNYFDLFNSEYENITGDLNPVNAGNYSVTVSIKSDVDAYWADGADNDTREDLTYTFTITKAPLTVKVIVDDDGTISLDCTGMVNNEPAPALELVYISKETNSEVAEEDLQPGVYDVEAKLSGDNGNYEITDLKPGELEIDTGTVDNKLLLAEPILTQTSFVYSGTNVDIQSYFEALNLSYEDIAGDLSPVNVGNYSVAVSIKSGVNAYWSDFADNDNCGALHYNFTITKAPLTVKVVINDDGTISIDCRGMVNGEPQPELDLVYKDSNGNVVTDLYNLEPGKYIITAVIHDTDSNYEIADLTNAEHDVLEEVVGDNTLILKPELTQNEFPYTGNVIDILSYFKDLDLTYEEVTGDLQVKDAGEYSVTVKFKEEAENVFWYDGSNDNSQPLVFNFTILPETIKDRWIKDNEGIPQLFTDGDKVDYIYYDKEGNLLYNDDGQPAGKDDLKPGETYKVLAVINDENSGNYVFDSTGTDKTDLLDFTVLYPVELEVPTLENAYLIYNGEEQTVVLIGYKSDYMEYDPVELTQIAPDNYVITISIKDGAYAEWADGQAGTEREINFEIGKASIISTWQFSSKSPILTTLPEDASVAYIITDMNGNTVNAENVNEDELYIVTAQLSEDSASKYYFAESGTDSVLTFFMYYNVADTATNSTFEDIFPLWALLIIALSLVGGAIVWSKVASNVRENSKDKKNNTQN